MNNMVAMTAVFYNAGSNGWSVPVTSVAANGHLLAASQIQLYSIRLEAGANASVRWDVNGGSQAPTFSFEDTTVFPEYHGPKLPDTISRNSVFSMSFPQHMLSGGDSVVIGLNKLNPSVTVVHEKSMDQTRQVVFTQQDLQQIDTGINIGQITIIHNQYQVYSGKQYCFSKQRIYFYRTFVR